MMSFVLLFVMLTTTTLIPSSEARYPEKLLSFGLVADNHFDTFPAGEQAPWEPDQHWIHEQAKRTTTVTGRRYDLAVDKMNEAVDVFNSRPDLDFVVNLGDIVNNDLMWNLKPILDAFNRAKAPKFHILGNHDRRAHNDRFGEKNVTQEKWLMSKLGLEKWHYSFTVAPFRFICLDSMIMELKNDPRRTAHIKFLDDELKDAKAKNEFVILFGHIVIGMKTNVLGPTIGKYNNVVAMFFGHHHKGGYTKQGSIHTVIIQGQIDTLTNAFALLDVYHDRIEMTGFGRVPTRVYYFDKDVAAAIKAREEAHVQTPEEGRTYDLGTRNQPPPPPELWQEPLQVMPAIKFPLQKYVKPSVLKALPNAGNTAFYNEWKKSATSAEVRSTETQIEMIAAQTNGPVPTLAAASTKVGGNVKKTKTPLSAIVVHTSTDNSNNKYTSSFSASSTPHLSNSPGRVDLWSYVLVLPSALLCLLVAVVCVSRKASLKR